jgi:protein-disulfide isomerase
MHPNACIAAEAAVCAEAQGRFWEMHDLLFTNQRRFTRRDVLELADMAGLDRGEFVECLDGPDSLERVRSDSIVGFQGVQGVGLESIGTPYFFVNGLLVRGAQPYADIEALVQRELLERGGTDDPESGALWSPRDDHTLVRDWRQLRRAGVEHPAPAAPHP